MPNKIWEKATVLPTGGQQQSFIRPNGVADGDLKLQNPLTPTLGNMSNVNPTGAPSMLHQAQQSMLNTTPANFFASPKPAQQPSVSPSQVTQPQQPAYTNNTGDPTQSVLNFLSRPSVDEIKSNRENESKKRLLLLADALRHIGNIYNTTQGATPQQFNSPLLEQENRYQQERQRQQRQRSMAVEQALAAAKQRADENYKNSTLALNAADLQRKINDAENQLKFDKEKYQRETKFKQDKFDADQYWAEQNLKLQEKQLGETIRSHKANEANARASNALSRDRLNYEKGKGSQAGKDEIMLPHRNMAYGNGKTKWIINEKTYKNAIPAIYKAMREKNLIQPLPTQSLYGESNEERFSKMRQLVENQYTSDIYNDWMERLGARTSDGYVETLQDKIVMQGGGGIHPRKK